nr:MAG TPA: hypothetical protein [Caudoviricetes sp.]
MQCRYTLIWTISSSTALPVLLCTACDCTYECQC